MTQRLARTIATGVAAVVAASALAAPAAADQLFATRAQALDEISHTVAVRIADGVATYTVQRQFLNRGKVPDEARLSIDLPTGAAATGLRIRASGTWHTGELLDRDVAAARYRELTGAGVHEARDPALLFWISSSQLYLQIFPVFPGTPSTVEYTLTVPARYAAGRYWLTYPRVEPPDAGGQPRAHRLVAPVVTVQPGWAPPAGGIVVDGKPVEPGKPVALPAAARPPGSAPASAGPDAPVDHDAQLPYGASAIDVPAARGAELRYTLAKLRVELQHGSLSELQLALVMPDGRLVDVAAGSSDLEARAAFDVQLPAPVRAAGRWRLLVRSTASSEIGALLRWTLALGDRTYAAADTPVFIPAGVDSRRLSIVGVEPPPMAAWTGRLGRVVASGARAISRLEVEAAPRLSAVPRRAQVVFVLDASHSAGATGLDAQLAIVRAYLTHVPDAEVEVVAVRRTARRVFGRFASAAEAPRLLEAAVRAGALAPGNGSALDEGGRLAAQLLAGRAGPQRVVLATDELVRSSLTEAALLSSLAALAPAAVVHVVVPADDGAARPSLARDDGASLSVLAAGHHGILARVSVAAAKTPELAPVVLELVRPTRIEHLEIAGKSPLSVGDVLREGEGLRLFDPDLAPARAPSTLALTGKLWSDPVRLELAATPAFSAATAAYVFGADEHGHLTDAELRTVALAARAVSPVTSYLAIEPGVRPSKIGLDDEEGGAGWGTIGTGRYGSIGCGVGVGGTFGTKTDLASLIATEACARKHAPAGPWSVELSIETTKDEIVDVAVLGGSPLLAACLAEAAWSTRLDATFHEARKTHVVELSGP